MQGLAFFLVFMSAFTHATWNLWAKQADGGLTFVWMFSTIAAAGCLPLAVIALAETSSFQIGSKELLLLLLSGLLHTGYFFFLIKGYRLGDLSLVYPLARCSGPLLATAAAIALLGEQPSFLARCGTLVIGLGAFILVGDIRALRLAGAGLPILFALLAGLTIATYTIVDKYTVGVLLVSPIVLEFFSNLGRSVLLAPLALRDTGKIKQQWRSHHKKIIGVAILAPVSYLLVLFALTFSAVSYVAPLREMSVLIGAIMGASILSEGFGRQRILGSCTIMVGLIVLTLH